MQSRWIHLKEGAITMRREGRSIGSIERELGIPRSTLSGWFKQISLSMEQRAVLKSNSERGRAEAQKKAAAWHRSDKANRIQQIENDVDNMLQTQLLDDRFPLEVALAFLYLGEGSKTKSGLGLGSSDPQILRFYVSALKQLYDIDPKQLWGELHLRYDQDEIPLKEYWSNETGIPIERFSYVAKDQRTAGRATYSSYHGVCYVGGGGVEIMRRLMYLARTYSQRTYMRD